MSPVSQQPPIEGAVPAPAAVNGSPDKAADFAILLSTVAVQFLGGSQTALGREAISEQAMPGLPEPALIETAPVPPQPLPPGAESQPVSPAIEQISAAPAGAQRPPAASDQPRPEDGNELLLTRTDQRAEPVRRTRTTAPSRGSSDQTGDETRDTIQEHSLSTIQEMLAAVGAAATPQCGPLPVPSACPPITAPGQSPALELVQDSIRRTRTAALAGSGDATEQGDRAAPVAAVLQPAHSIGQALTTAHEQTALVPHGSKMEASAAPAPAAERTGLTSDVDLRDLDALVHDIARISGSGSRATFRLTAEQLGPMEVRLHTSDAGVSVSIRAQTEQGHSTVIQAQQQLSDDLRANGLKVAATSVMLGEGGADRQHQDRAPLPLRQQIEVAPGEPQQSRSPDEQRPAGRYA